MKSSAEVRMDLGDPAFQEWTSTVQSDGDPVRVEVDQTQYDHGDPTAHEQYLLELINHARADPNAEAARLGIDLNEGLTPGTISPEPKPPLALNPMLIQAARDHSAWMLDENVFNHTGVNNSSPGDRMETANYVFTAPAGWGENIAWRGTTASSFNLTQYVELLHDGLFKSKGHRKNLMNASFDELGLGVETGYFYKDGTDWNAAMATEKFAYSASTPGPMIVGVVFRDADEDGFYDPGEGMPGITVTPASGAYFAVTSASGGYALPFSGTGELNVTFAGEGLSGPVVGSIQRASRNVKLDVEADSVVPVELAIEPQNASGSSYRLMVNGPAGLAVQIERSTDLDLWTWHTNLVLGGGTTEWVDPDVPSDRAVYRLVLP